MSERASNSHKTKAILGIVAVIGVLGLVSILAISAGSPSTVALQEYQLAQAEFKSYLLSFGKSYDNSEYEDRFSTFRTNSAYIRLQNSLSGSWKMGVNKFADLKTSEFKSRLLGTKLDYSPKTQEKKVHQLYPSITDWRTSNKVTAVKDQMMCGSCWAFSTTGAIESAWAIAKGDLVSLSEQQLVDCSWKFDNYGCNGGLMDSAFQYVIHNGGIASEASYPYVGEDMTCKKLKSKLHEAKIRGFADVTSNDSNALASAVAQQPVSVAVDATIWQFYQSGVLDSSLCGTELNHGVLAVGYDMGEGYWIVKNSWGAEWGENGYIRLTIEEGLGTCGVQMYASYPVV